MWCNGTPLKTKDPPPTLPFDLGAVGSSSDMQCPSPSSAFEECNFPIHSFAFVLRSNGQWTYAIVANRPVIDGPLASIRFVVDEYGSTKTLKKRHWERYIRLVKDGTCHEQHQDGERRNNNMGQELHSGCLDHLRSFRRALSSGAADLSTMTNGD